jgi:hypothetical protein
MREFLKSLVMPIAVVFPLVALADYLSNSKWIATQVIERIDQFSFWLFVLLVLPYVIQLINEVLITIYWFLFLKRKSEDELLKELLTNEWPTSYWNDPELYFSELVDPNDSCYRADLLPKAYQLLMGITPISRGGRGNLASIARLEISFRRAMRMYLEIKDPDRL